MTTEFDFDAPITRAGTGCVKYDGLGEEFGRDDVIPLWVADMDFAAPGCVKEALAARIQHPVYGYSMPGDGLGEAFCGWFERRHGWKIDLGQVLWSPGTDPILIAAIEALTEPGDKILVPTPVYPAFLSIVEHYGRELVPSPLLEADGAHHLDFEHLEKQAAAGAKLLLLCSPHNPVGRAWQVGELDHLIDIALRHRMVIVSDEVHADFAFPHTPHTPLATRAPTELRLVTALSSAKTFNMPGMGLSAAVVSNAADRSAVGKVFERGHLNPYNPLTMAAFEAAWAGGDVWLDALMGYLDENRRWLVDEICGLDGLRAFMPDATFLMWVDCRDLGRDADALQDFWVNEAGLGVGAGEPYGPGGAGHIRLNFGTQRVVLRRAMDQLRAALARV